MGPVHIPMKFEHVQSVRRQRDQLFGAHYLPILPSRFAQSGFVQIVVVCSHDGGWRNAGEGFMCSERDSTPRTDLINYEGLYGVRITVLLSYRSYTSESAAFL